MFPPGIHKAVTALDSPGGDVRLSDTAKKGYTADQTFSVKEFKV